MKKRVEQALEDMSILRAYLLDVARLHEEEKEMHRARLVRAEARGIELAMSSLKKTARNW